MREVKDSAMAQQNAKGLDSGKHAAMVDISRPRLLSVTSQGKIEGPLIETAHQRSERIRNQNIEMVFIPSYGRY